MRSENLLDSLILFKDIWHTLPPANSTTMHSRQAGAMIELDALAFRHKDTYYNLQYWKCCLKILVSDCIFNGQSVSVDSVIVVSLPWDLYLTGQYSWASPTSSDVTSKVIEWVMIFLKILLKRHKAWMVIPRLKLKGKQLIRNLLKIYAQNRFKYHEFWAIIGGGFWLLVDSLYNQKCGWL